MEYKWKKPKPFPFPDYDLREFRSRRLPVTDPEELLAMASSPDTAPDSLIIIWLKSRSINVKHALARNPSTPVVALVRLWELDHGAILENPVVALWEFSKPGSTQKILPASLQYAFYQFLLECPDFEEHLNYVSEEEVVRMLVNNDGYRLKVPIHCVARDRRSRVRCALLQDTVRFESENIGRPVEFPVATLEALASDSSGPVLRALAVALAERWILPEPCDADFVIRLAWHLHSKGDPSISRPISRWPFLNEELVERLAVGADDELLADLAKHPKASVEFHTRLAGHDSEVIRAAVASSTTCEALQRRFFTDRNPPVRWGLASCPHLSPELQQGLFESKDPRVLLSLLKNPATLGGILEQLATLPNLGITFLLREHPNTPSHFRDTLLNHSSDCPQREP